MTSPASPREHQTDVVVVGAGNAGLIAAIEARLAGLDVLLLEASPASERGGNSRLASGVYRIAHGGKEEIRELVGDPSVPWDQLQIEDYPAETYVGDLVRTTRGDTDLPLLTSIVDLSGEVVRWLRDQGVRWTLSSSKFMNVEAIGPGETIRLPRGGELMAEGNGHALVETLFERADALGVEIWYESPALELVTEGFTVVGVDVVHDDASVRVRSHHVILACGSFEASPEARLRYLGHRWDLARVRGTRYNTGRMLDAAIRAGALASGHWGGAHAVAVAEDSPVFGSVEVGDLNARYSFPYGITVNAHGKRFMDEGVDEMNFSYATVGAQIIDQPGGVAFQLFDQRTVGLLEPRYATSTPLTANTLTELAAAAGIDAEGLSATVAAFNAACSDRPFDPYAKDGLSASPDGQPVKSNWATPLEEPPFVAYSVRCGITFAFAGLWIDGEARVMAMSGRPMRGLYACGEIAGGIISHNLPGGTGLVKGGALALVAARSAAKEAQ